MYCNKCGNKIKEDARFCGSCGNPTSIDASKVVEVSKKSNDKTLRNVLIIVGCIVLIPVVLVVISMVLLYFPVWR